MVRKPYEGCTVSPLGRSRRVRLGESGADRDSEAQAWLQLALLHTVKRVRGTGAGALVRRSVVCPGRVEAQGSIRSRGCQQRCGRRGTSGRVKAQEPRLAGLAGGRSSDRVTASGTAGGFIAGGNTWDTFRQGKAPKGGIPGALSA
jgi:hypothetical protein